MTSLRKLTVLAKTLTATHRPTHNIKTKRSEACHSSTQYEKFHALVTARKYSESYKKYETGIGESNLCKIFLHKVNTLLRVHHITLLKTSKYYIFYIRNLSIILKYECMSCGVIPFQASRLCLIRTIFYHLMQMSR
jgi:hypothetical protein